MNSSSTTKTILFWMSIVFLGIMLWKLVSTNKPNADNVSYSHFLEMVGRNEIRDARIYLDANSVSVSASRRDSQQRVSTTLSYGDWQDLKERLIDSGATVEYTNQKKDDWVLLLLNGLPLLLLVVFCLFLMQRMRAGAWRGAQTSLPKTHTGIGYDLHRLEYGRPLIIGGIELPFDKGPVGHSDGDVLAHALCDALLGAAGLGDIGTHFPDTDPQWKGANSLLFLEHAKKLLADKNFAIEHVDAVVVTEKPKLGPHFPKMREALAKALGVSADKIHLKAKTNEGVDAVGRGEAIAAHVVATLSSR